MATSSTPAPRRGLARKALLGAILSLVVLALLEIAARVATSAGRGAAGGAYFDSFRDLVVELGGFDDADRLLESDAELFWKLRPGVHGLPWHPPLWLDNRSNALGYRDPERSFEAPAGTLRLFCLGNSCTYGLGVRVEESWPQALEALLATTYHDRLVEAWNGGVPGWSSDQGRTLLARDGARVRPAFVLVEFGINDARHWDLAHHKERGHGGCLSDREARARLSSAAARSDRALESLALYRLIRGALAPERREALARESGPSASDTGGGPRVPDPDFRDNLRAIATESRRLGAQPIFLLWPIRWQLESQAGRELDPPTSYQLSIRAMGAELDVPVVDLLERFAGASGLYVDSVHMNAQGCHRVAEEIGRFLYAHKMLPEPPRPNPR
jgi:lysophospholipase L1-like esterase